ncbi:gamma-tubulin [Pichia californica]|nr:gamma-tubulin [[Candida] californica]
MGGEVLTLQAGQCGNQIGQQFWSQLCNEHGINSDGTLSESYNNISKNDNPDIFFQRNKNNSFTPRSLLIDLEPRVIGKIMEGNNGLFDPKNVYLSSDGIGAGNRWGEGYVSGKRNLDTILDMIDRELDGCDNLEGFQLLHSVSGGTGSGFGSLLLETLSDRYNKKLIQTFSVFGNTEVVVSPYNSILTLKRLIQNSDANIVFNNNSLMSISPNDFINQKDNQYDNINELISTVMSACTNTIRFPSYSYNSLTSIISTLIPTPDLHFLTPSYTPFTLDSVSNASKDIRRSTSYDVILELLDKKLNMFCNGNKDDKVLAMMDIIIGANKKPIDNKHNSNIQKALIKARSRIEFAPWTPSTVHLALGKKSEFSKSGDDDIVSGLMLTNSTSILHVIKDITKDYDQLMRKNAFMNNFLKGEYSQECGDLMQEFEESREVVEALIGEYTSSETLEYMEGEYEDDSNSDISDDDGDIDEFGTINSSNIRSLHSIELIEENIENKTITDAYDSDGINEFEEKVLDYPEGGRTAYLTVFACFMGLIAEFGLWNSTGAIESYISAHILIHDNEMSISMIFSLFSFIVMFGTLIAGVLFDKYGAKELCYTGCVLTTGGLMATANSTKLYQFILSFGVCCGIGCACLSAPFVATIGHYFCEKRGMALSIVMPGASLGGVIWPLVCRSLYTKIGFEWTIRVLGFCVGTILLIAAICINDRHDEIMNIKIFNEKKEKKMTFKETINELLDFKSFKDLNFMTLTGALCLNEFSLLMVSTYIPSYALSQGFSEGYSLIALTIYNAAGVIGRMVPAFLSDKYGNFNLMIVMSAMMSLTIWILWLPFGHNLGVFTAFTIIYGFAVAGTLSLTPLCTSAISKPKDFGKRYGTAYFFVGFCNLISLPIGMALTETSGGYNAMVAFAGATCTLATFGFFYTRYELSGDVVSFRPHPMLTNTLGRRSNDDSYYSEDEDRDEYQYQYDYEVDAHENNDNDDEYIGRGKERRRDFSDRDEDTNTYYTNNGDSLRQIDSKEGVVDSTIPITEHVVEYPEGGRTAYITLFGCFIGLVAEFGLWNSTGAIESYIASHILVNESDIAISMIFALFSFFVMFGTMISGVVFDKYGSKELMYTGTILTCGGLMATANCTKLYQFILAFGVTCGIGCSLLTSPFVTSISHFFHKKRGMALSIVMPGASLGGVIWPLVCRSLYTKVGFQWTIRTLGFCIGFLMLVASICVHDRHVEIIRIKKLNEGEREMSFKDKINDLLDFKSFKELTFMILTSALFLNEFSLLMVSTYIPSYALSKGFSESFSLIALTIFNAAGVIGRIVPTFLSDKYGNFNLITAMSAIMSLSIWIMWLPFGQHIEAFIIFTIIFGFAVAGTLALTPLCTSAISKPKDFGKRYGTAYFCVAFCNLISLPVGMALTETSAGYDAMLSGDVISFRPHSLPSNRSVISSSNIEDDSFYNENTEVYNESSDADDIEDIDVVDSKEFTQSTHTNAELVMEFPEGGRTAYITLFGCFIGLVGEFGLWNTIGAIESYVSSHILVNESDIAISMIFALYSFFVMFGTMLSGIIFDKYGGKQLMIIGTIMVTGGLIATANCTKIYQFILAFGVVCGIGCSLLTTPFVTSISHFFNKKRGFALSIVMPGASLGGVIWPLVCRSLYTKIGFEWTIRVLGFCIGALLIVATFCVQDRHIEIMKIKKLNEGEKEMTLKEKINDLVDFKSFKDLTFMCFTCALFLSEYALLMVSTYIPSYALNKGFSESFSLLALTIFNAAGILGRIIPTMLSDRYGNFNLIILMTVIMTFSVWVLWLPLGQHIEAFIIFTITFGFAVAGTMALTPLCTSAISSPKDFGKKYGTAYFIVAFCNLTALPIGMALTETSSGYNAMVAFAGATCTLSTICFIYTRYRIGGLNKISI